MKKKQVKSKSPTPVKQHTAIDTPRFKEKASQLSQIPQSPKIQLDSEYFSFGGMEQHKKQSKSVHEFNDKEKKLNNSFTKDKKVTDTKPQKVQIFNTDGISLRYISINYNLIQNSDIGCNNYQIININQIEKKESIRSLQRQFQQILENQVPKKSATPVKTNLSSSPIQNTATKAPAFPSANNYSLILQFCYISQLIYTFIQLINCTSKESKNQVNPLCQGKSFDQQIYI